MEDNKLFGAAAKRARVAYRFFFFKLKVFINEYARSLINSLHYINTRPLVGTRGGPSSPPLDPTLGSSPFFHSNN